MRFLIPASSILCAAGLLLLAGCESIGIPNHLARHDEVPPEVRAEPVIINVPPQPADTDDMPWPRLGDVPFMPKDFSPKPVYNHYMNEMEFQRDESGVAKNQLEQKDIVQDPALAPTLPPALPPGLIAPQFAAPAAKE